MNKLKSLTREQIYSYLIGIGIMLQVIHNPNQPGMKFFFLPVVGLVFILFPAFEYLLHNKGLNLGNKWLWIPLAVITGSIVLYPLYSFLSGEQNYDSIVYALVAIGFFSLYLLSRKLGKDIFKIMPVLCIIASLSTVYGYIVIGSKNGGLISPTNYDIATGFIVFSFIASDIKHRWWLSAIAITGLFFTGSDEAIFACVVIAIFVLIRRDFSKKILLPVVTLIIILAVCTSLGITQKLYFSTVQKTAAIKEVVEETPIAKAADKIIPNVVTDKIEKAKPDIKEYKEQDITDKNAYLDKATGFRWLSYWNLSPIKPLGYGFNMFNFYKGIPHNVPMIIIEQIGILGALAWCFAAGYGLFKTKWRYAWLGFIALGIFDHFTWTMAAPWFWVLAGVSTSDNIQNDYIFKKKK